MVTLETLGAQTPLGCPGQPVDLVGLYVQLASSETSDATGQIYGAAGGNGLP